MATKRNRMDAQGRWKLFATLPFTGLTVLDADLPTAQKNYSLQPTSFAGQTSSPAPPKRSHGSRVLGNVSVCMNSRGQQPWENRTRSSGWTGDALGSFLNRGVRQLRPEIILHWPKHRPATEEKKHVERDHCTLSCSSSFSS